MNFGLSMELSKDLLNRLPLIDSMSKELEKHFREKNYGKGLETITIGIVCVSPNFDFFFKKRKNYSDQKRLLEFDIKIDYDSFKNANDQEVRQIILREIKTSFTDMVDLSIAEFDLNKFLNDFEVF